MCRCMSVVCLSHCIEKISHLQKKLYWKRGMNDFFIVSNENKRQRPNIDQNFLNQKCHTMKVHKQPWNRNDAKFCKNLSTGKGTRNSIMVAICHKTCAHSINFFYTFEKLIKFQDTWIMARSWFHNNFSDFIREKRTFQQSLFIEKIFTCVSQSGVKKEKRVTLPGTCENL